MLLLSSQVHLLFNLALRLFSLALPRSPTFPVLLRLPLRLVLLLELAPLPPLLLLLKLVLLVLPQEPVPLQFNPVLPPSLAHLRPQLSPVPLQHLVLPRPLPELALLQLNLVLLVFSLEDRLSPLPPLSPLLQRHLLSLVALPLNLLPLLRPMSLLFSLPLVAPVFLVSLLSPVSLSSSLPSLPLSPASPLSSQLSQVLTLPLLP